MELPNVLHTIESLGSWEIELEIETESLEDFYNLIIISNELKLDFFPEWL